MSLLDVQGATKRFRGLVAVDNVTLSVPQGSIFAVIGPNGAGKTTLFNLIAGVYVPDGGSISFEDARIDGLGPDQVCRRGLARTFQIVRPFPALSVHENAAIGAMLHERDPAKAFVQAEEVLRRLDLWDKRAQKAASMTLPDRKRLEVARALATRPRLLLLDEVMAGLRPTETDRVVEILRALNREQGITILMIEHVMRAVMALADRVHVLNHGASIAEGTPQEVTRDPRVIASYLGAEALH
jgi:branched-chain amino acid transport system ATP-binding protein